MSAHEEVEEHIEHAHNPFDKVVAGCMAIIAACLAVVSVLGGHFNTEKLLTQQKASDEWAYYQAKDIRLYNAQLANDVLIQMKGDPAVTKKYLGDVNRYKRDKADIQEKARDFEKERDKMGNEADSFHVGEVFLEVAIVLSSLSILTKRRPLFYGGLGSAVVGIIISIGGYVLYGVLGKV
jgi:hypothetical protein